MSLHTFSSEQQLAINHTCFNTSDTLLTTLLANLIGFFSLTLGVASPGESSRWHLHFDPQMLVLWPDHVRGEVAGKIENYVGKPSSYSKRGCAWTSPLVQTESFPGYIGARSEVQLVNKSAY